MYFIFANYILHVYIYGEMYIMEVLVVCSTERRKIILFVFMQNASIINAYYYNKCFSIRTRFDISFLNRKNVENILHIRCTSGKKFEFSIL